MLVLAFILLVLLMFYKYQKASKSFSKIPGPPGYSIIGQYSDFIVPLATLFQNIRQKSLIHYPIYKEWVLGFKIVHLMHPEDIKIVLTNRSNAKIVSFLNNWLGSSVFNSNGKKCYYKRKLITKAFYLGNLQNYVDMFQQNAENLITAIQQPYNNAIEVEQYISIYFIKCAKAFAFGTHSTLNERSYLKTMRSIKECITCRLTNPLLMMLKNYIYNSTSLGRRELRAALTLHSLTYNEIQHQKGKRTEKCEVQMSTTSSVLETLLKSKENGADIDDKDIREEIDVMMMAGHDPTVINLSFLLMLLANHKQVQDRIVGEIHSVLGNFNKAPDQNDLKNFTYMEHCIKECLRLYPSVPILFRRCQKPFTTYTGYSIPKGSLLLIDIFNLHHNPNVYPDPEKFDPDRFLPENISQRHPFAFIPFGAGYRNCLGQKLAIMQMKIALCAILKTFVLEPVDTPQTVTLTADLLLTTEKRIKVKFLKRDLLQ